MTFQHYRYLWDVQYRWRGGVGRGGWRHHGGHGGEAPRVQERRVQGREPKNEIKYTVRLFSMYADLFELDGGLKDICEGASASVLASSSGI